MKTKLSLIIFLLFSFNEIIFSQSAGNTGLAFLKFSYGAKNAAMGDIGNVISNDVTALFYNPSRLTSLENPEIFFMHNGWIQDVNSEIIGAAFKIKSIPFAVGVNSSRVSDIEVRTKPGDYDTKFDAQYFYGSLSSAIKLYKNFSFGFSIKYYYEGMLEHDAQGIGFDFGANYRLMNKVDISASVRNVGTMSEMKDEKTNLPSEIRFGVGSEYEIHSIKSKVSSGVEYQKYFDVDESHFHFGLEFLFNNLLAIRGGYMANYEAKDFTFGFGLIWGRLNLDYAYSPLKYDLGSGNSISIKLRF